MQTEQTVIEFLAVQSQTPVDQLESGTPLFGSVVFRSMLVLQLIAFLEKTFGIEIGPDELIPENFKTIGTVAAFAEQKRALLSQEPAVATGSAVVAASAVASASAVGRLA